MLPEFDLAQAIGMLSFALGILCFYQRDDQHLRIMMVVMNLNHALHFALLGAVTACLSALLSVVRTGISIKTRSRSVAYLFILISQQPGCIWPKFGTIYSLFWARA